MSTSAPYSIRPAIPVDDINRPVVLYEGPIEFSEAPSKLVTGDGSICWRWLPTTGPRFEVAVEDATSLFNEASVEAGAPGQPAVEAFISTAEGLGSGTVAGHMEDFRVGVDKEVDHLVFHLPNFVNYVGSAIQDKVEEGVSSRTGRIELEFDGWQVQIDNLSTTKQTIEGLKQEGGFGITHVARIRQVSSDNFKFDQASDILDALGFFLSFICGLWIQPILIKGFPHSVDDEDRQQRNEPVLTVARNARLDPWASTMTWFSKHIADALPTLFRKFWSKWSKSASQDVLRQVIGWYLEANGGASSLQSRLILAQVALEMMAYEVLTDASGNEPNGPAADLIRKTLSKLGIPESIPGGMSNLQALASSDLLKGNSSDPDFDGPGITVAIRNALVHSKRAKRNKRDALTPGHYVDAWQLTLWHLELSLLAWIGYDQEYSCRWKDGWVGEVEPVPWNVQSASSGPTGIPTAS